MKTNSIKIICTLGPASSDKKTITRMISAGANAFRINTAHGTVSQYDSLIKAVRSVSVNVPIIVDLKGPEIRLRANASVNVKRGQELIFGFSNSHPLYFNKNFYSKIAIGHGVLFENGKYSAKVAAKKNGTLVLKFHADSVLQNNKGVNIPGIIFGASSLSQNDLNVIKWAKRKKLSFFALSFSRTAEDIRGLRKKVGKDSVIIAKIESREGIKNFAEILEECDGAMVARGDLGAEVQKESIPLLQKKMVKQCINAGKFSIVATQMLESMIENEYPTRAEINDIANSVLDGADCLMLSGETAVGVNPVAAVDEMRKSSTAVEGQVPNMVEMGVHSNVSDSITKSVYELSHYLKVNKIIAFTKSGYTAKMISRFRVPIPIIGLCWSPVTFKLLCLNFGVRPFLLPRGVDVHPNKAMAMLKKNGLLKAGETVIITGNIHSDKKNHSNLIEVHTVN